MTNTEIQQRLKKMYQKRLDNGQCNYCHKPATHGRMCDYHWSKRSDYQKQYRLEIRDEVYSHYGNKCACCGESQVMFLTIDHVNNDGNVHRSKVFGGSNKAGGGHKMNCWIKKNNYPKGIQLLCYNCNNGKHRNGGICPHKAV